MSLGSTDLFFSAQALLIMRSSVIWRSSTGLGAERNTSTVLASTLATLLMPCTYGVKFEVLDMARLSEYTASSAVKAEPSWNFTPERRLKRICVGLISFHEVASTGSTSKVLLL